MGRDEDLGNGRRMYIVNLRRDVHGHAVINRWKEWAENGEWNTLVTELLVMHYDPSYTRSTPHNLSGFAQARTLDLSQLSTAELSLAATELLSD